MSQTVTRVKCRRCNNPVDRFERNDEVRYMMIGHNIEVSDPDGNPLIFVPDDIYLHKCPKISIEGWIRTMMRWVGL